MRNFFLTATAKKKLQKDKTKSFGFILLELLVACHPKSWRRKATLGFTLLELLVVIGLISVLAGIGISSYSTAQQKARDARRKSDVKEIQSALEQYYSVCKYNYPASLGTSIQTTTPTCTEDSTILSTVPTDPKTGAAYDTTGPNGSISSTAYKICITLETEKDGAGAAVIFCLNNQQ